MRREVRTVVGLRVLIVAVILRSDNTRLTRELRHGKARFHIDSERVAMLLGDLANTGKVDGALGISEHKRHVTAGCRRPVSGTNRRRFRRASIIPLRAIPRVVVIPHLHVERIHALGSSRVAVRASGITALVVHQRGI